jgi:hypothetical protein
MCDIGAGILWRTWGRPTGSAYRCPDINSVTLPSDSHAQPFPGPETYHQSAKRRDGRMAVSTGRGIGPDAVRPRARPIGGIDDPMIVCVPCGVVRGISADYPLVNPLYCGTERVWRVGGIKVATESRPRVDNLGEDGVTLAKAAELLGVSERTVRRKLKNGDVPGELAFDPEIGTERWMVDTSELLTARSQSAVLVPLEAIDRLELAWTQTREAVARAEIAERVAQFEKERRIEAESDRDRMRELLNAEAELATRVSNLEKRRRLEAERERDRLRSLLEAEEVEPTWWQRFFWGQR